MIRALAEGYFSHDGGPTSARLDDFVREIDAFVSPASKTLRFSLRVTLAVLRVLPLVVLGRFALFETLPLRDRTALLNRLEQSKFAPFTLIFIAWKTIFTMVFFEHADEMAAMGYPGAERSRWKRATGAITPPSALTARLSAASEPQK